MCACARCKSSGLNTKRRNRRLVDCEGYHFSGVRSMNQEHLVGLIVAWANRLRCSPQLSKHHSR